MKKFKIILIAVYFIVLGATGSAYAQYFGRNKVMYDNFNFKVMHTRHFDIYYYKEEKDAVKYAARMAERWYTRHSIILDDTLTGKQPLILYDGFQQFSETNVTQGQIGQGTGGFTEPVMRRIVLPFAGPLAETNHVIGHELVHAFQFDITGKGKSKDENGLPAASKMPLWFIEGMAEYLSLGPKDPFTAMWMRDAVITKIPDISDLDNPKYFPYRYGQSLLAFIGGKWGNKKIGQLLRRAAYTGSMKSAIDSVFSMKPDSLSKLWHNALHAQYDSLAKVTKRPKDYGKDIIKAKKGAEQLNVSPALSPDGKKVIFFSSRDLFSIDLYLADAKTGKIERNIFKTEFNTHLQNLEFINSSGTWDPSGKRFAFSAVADGRPVLSLLNVKSGDVERTIRFPKLAEIFNPAWSPDGKEIAFSALADGLTDLFVYDLKTDSLKRLTHDPYADLQPAWSPDGKSIAFATDRFSTEMADLDIGNYELAIINPETKKISRLPDFSDAKNINPQWSPDGKKLYFVSDHHGVSNIYKLNIASGTIDQVTNLFEGVSGITSLSPALSVALDSNKIVYSAYVKGLYSIYSIDSAKTLNGEKPLPEFAAANPGILPPAIQLHKKFINDLENPGIGLPPQDTVYKTNDYSPSLRVNGVGQPSVAAGADRFGTYVGGGIALFWSDLLGNYQLATALQIQSGGGFTNISGLLGYMNQAHRLHYGGAIQQIPYYISGYNAGFGVVDSQDAYIEQQYLYKETIRDASGMLAYPFSEVLRAEFSAGFRNISFSNQVQTRAISLNTNNILINRTENLSHEKAMNLGTFSLALVYDNSYFGATSPLIGSRYRLEVDPYFGSINWVNVLADYRQYYMPIRPFSFAARILHAGRYGSGAEDHRLAPEYLGYPGLVRGYESSSFNSYEGGVFNNIIGSKIIVANFELRFPLLGVFGLGDGFYGYFPIETAFFYDAGVAWTNNDKPKFLGGDRKPVSSAGIAFRVNLFGYAVGEVDYVHPFSRPGNKWLWQFNLTEGF